MGSAAAIVLAGGSGTRFGAGRNKVYLPLGGRTVLGWSLRAFLRHPEIAAVVLVVRAEDRESAEPVVTALITETTTPSGADPAGDPGQGRATYPGGQVQREHSRGGGPSAAPARAMADGCAAAPVVQVVTGGGTRQESELSGLRHLAPDIASGEIDTVLVHDGARPLVSAELISAVLVAARACGGAVPGVLRADIGAVTSDGTGLRWPPSAGALVAVQTPQGFRAEPLLAAYEEADRHGFVGTDTASCAARFTDLDVRWVAGDQRNLKITYAHDLVLAEHALARR